MSASDLKSLVLRFLDRNKDATKEVLHKHFKGANLETVDRYWRGFRKEIQDQKNMDRWQSSTQKSVDPHNRKFLPLPEYIDFFDFCRWFSYPAYKGLWNWQKEHHIITWPAKYEMTLVPRDHGKSVEYSDKYQWAMWYHQYDVLLLGWTDRRKQIAIYVYTFFNERGLIKEGQVHRSSPYHFTLVNGVTFDCYLISSKEPLGMHAEGEQDRFKDLTPDEIEELKSLYKGDLELEDEVFDEETLKQYIAARKKGHKLWVSVDDPLDITFMKERYREKDLEMRFASTLYSINPDKWSFTGTHKFEGDIFDFWDNMFGDKLVKYIRAPILEDGSLLCPERFTHPDLLTYEKDLVVGKKDLQEIREHIGEYAWWSDWCQQPHPITGEIWDHVKFVFTTKEMHAYDMMFMFIDRATTTKKSSSYTGCLAGLREAQTGKRLIINDFTGKIPLEDLLILVNNYLIEFYNKYGQMIRRIILVVEKQGGGDDFINLAKTRKAFFDNEGTIIENKIPEIAEIIDIHSTGDKLRRIEDRLRAPLINERIEFLESLRQSKLVRDEILTFPNCAHFDGIDALATGDFEIMNIPYGDPSKQLEALVFNLENRMALQKMQNYRNRTPIFDNPIENPDYYKQRGRRY